MFWLDNNTGIPTAPDVPPVISTSKRFFTNGGAGVQPSVPEDFWHNMIQEELLGVLTLAGITPDKSDLNQVAKAIQSIAFRAYPVGAPIPWPTEVPPAGFLAMTGQSFSAETYPKLALAYPSGVLPDMRAYSVRGWDAGRGIDVGRTILTAQNDAGRRIYGSVEIGFNYRQALSETTGPFSSSTPTNNISVNAGPASGSQDSKLVFDSQLAIPLNTAPEFIVKNIAFNYIVVGE